MAGGFGFLRRFLPQSKLRRLLLTGERIPASELYRPGVLEACLPTEELLPAATQLAAQIAAKSPVAVSMLKELFNMVENLSLRDGYRRNVRSGTAPPCRRKAASLSPLSPSFSSA